MITTEIFNKQRNKKRAEFKKQKLEIYPNFGVFFYLVKQRPNSFGKLGRYVELKKLDDKGGRKERHNYLRYKLSDYKEKGLNKLYPILEEVKFREVIVDLPVQGSIDEEHTLEYVFSVAGIVFEKVY